MFNPYRHINAEGVIDCKVYKTPLGDWLVSVKGNLSKKYATKEAALNIANSAIRLASIERVAR